MTTSTLTPRQSFRETVALVAARAKERLPESINGRIESAVRLVLAHDVTVLEDGTVEVGSSSDPLKTHTVAGKACDCQDYAYGKAPQGWCQHRLAVAILLRVQEERAAQLPAPVEPPVEPWPDNDPEETTVPVPPAPQSLPEAAASVNVRLMIDGRDCQLTLRDTDEARLLERLQAVLKQYPAPQAPQAPQSQPRAGHGGPTQGQKKEWCAVHDKAMKHNQKDGRSWWSHWDEQAGRWCKGR